MAKIPGLANQFTFTLTLCFFAYFWSFLELFVPIKQLTCQILHGAGTELLRVDMVLLLNKGVSAS